MSRVTDALRRAAGEQQPDGAAKPDDHIAVVVEEAFPAEVPVENLAFTGQKLTSGKSSPPLLIGAAQNGARPGVAHLGSDRPAPHAAGPVNAATEALSNDLRTSSDWRALPAEVRRKRSGSFEDLILAIARDEQRMNL